MLASDDCPPYLREEKFSHAMTAWSWAEATVSLLRAWLAERDFGDAMAEVIEGTEDEDARAGGGVKRRSRSRRVMPTLMALDRWEVRAARLRAELGLSPASFAVLARDVSLTRKSQEDALERMSEEGRRHRESRDAWEATELDAAEREGREPRTYSAWLAAERSAGREVGVNTVPR